MYHSTYRLPEILPSLTEKKPSDIKMHILQTCNNNILPNATLLGFPRTTEFTWFRNQTAKATPAWIRPPHCAQRYPQSNSPVSCTEDVNQLCAGGPPAMPGEPSTWLALVLEMRHSALLTKFENFMR